MSGVGQQILALDARYNVRRAPGDAALRTLYIRRRSQLLREHARTHPAQDPALRTNYLRLRREILGLRLGGVCGSEGSVASSRRRSESLATLETEEEEAAPTIVPTPEARASRALVGDTTLADHFSFAGVHHVFEHHCPATVRRLRFAHDEPSTLAAASDDGSLSICQVGEENRLVRRLEGHSGPVTDFAFSSANDVIASVSRDGSLRVWSVAEGVCIRVVEPEPLGPLLACVFQPLNNNLVVVGGERGAVEVANISTGKLVKGAAVRLAGAVTALAADDNGRLLWAGDEKGFVHAFRLDLASGKLAKGRRTLVCQGRRISSLSSRAWISREARDPHLLCSVPANILCLYRVEGKEGRLAFRAKIPVRHSEPSSGVRSAFCPLMSFRAGAVVLSGSEDGGVHLFDVERVEGGRPCVNRLQGHSATVTDLAFNADESFLASADATGTIIVWKRQKPPAE